jgi:hypothetical protein
MVEAFPANSALPAGEEALVGKQRGLMGSQEPSLLFFVQRV